MTFNSPSFSNVVSLVVASPNRHLNGVFSFEALLYERTNKGSRNGKGIGKEYEDKDGIGREE